ncbi:hypothetical protein RNJ44_00355 [Nakaseomyces bracarensis]|uniref:Uncharacterized protein n=1 Tax=Nakaseomyces bracarensis TaxID=273131 RepID=A0ABR4NSB8_9SACH
MYQLWCSTIAFPVEVLVRRYPFICDWLAFLQYPIGILPAWYVYGKEIMVFQPWNPGFPIESTMNENKI